MKWISLALAAAVVLAANLFVLTGVLMDRSGGPVRTIVLTQRELAPGTIRKEDSGVILRLRYNSIWEGDADKADELGFDSKRLRGSSKRFPQLQRPVFVALEYAGPAWETWQARIEKPGVAENAEERRQRIEESSRLVVVDAAASPEPLLRKYPDGARYLIVRGLASVSAANWEPRVFIRRALPEVIHVPLPYASTLDPSRPYTVELYYGRHFQPWVNAVRASAK